MDIKVTLADNTDLTYPENPAFIPGLTLYLKVYSGENVTEALMNVGVAICKAYDDRGYKVRFKYSCYRKDVDEFVNEVEDEDDLKSKLLDFIYKQLADNIIVGCW